MFDFLNGLLEILSDLLPDRNQPFRLWVARLVVLTGAFLGIFYALFFTFRDTTLGERYGINSNKIVLPTSTEYGYTSRHVLDVLSTYKNKHIEHVSNIFLVAIYNKMANDFVVTIPEENRDFFVWAWSVPIQKFSNLENMDYLLNSEKDFIFSTGLTDPNKKSCISARIPDKIKKKLDGFLLNDQSTHFSICPIRDRSNKYTIAFTIAFTKTEDIMTLNMLVYRQQLVTIETSRVFSKYTIPYGLSDKK